MKIAIINSKDLNGCWSALQYTNSCELCDKVETCKIKSQYHKNGVVKYFDEKEARLKAELTEKEQKLKQSREQILNIF